MSRPQFKPFSTNLRVKRDKSRVTSPEVIVTFKTHSEDRDRGDTWRARLTVWFRSSFTGSSGRPCLALAARGLRSARSLQALSLRHELTVCPCSAARARTHTRTRGQLFFSPFFPFFLGGGLSNWRCDAADYCLLMKACMLLALWRV